MRYRLFILVIALWSAILLIGCVPIPYLPFDLSEEETTKLGNFYVGKKEAKDLLEQLASREKVIETLGRPLRYRANYVNYKSCYRKGGVLIIVPYPWPMPLYESGGDRKCIVLEFAFDDKNKLKQILETSEHLLIDEKAEDMMLRNYGLEGDSVAQGLWLKSKTYFKKYYPEEVKNKAENGDIAAQWKIYLLQPVSEHLVWLCRSADQGHLLARKELGMLYLFGSEDYRKFRDFQINPDLSRSCMWLHLAGHVDITGSPISTNGLLVPTPYQSVEVERIARRLSPHQLAEAENMVVEWEAGQCQRDFSSYQSTVDLNITDIADICLDADLGSMSARETLGRKYYFGNGVPEDLKRSYMWYSLAAKVYIPPWMKAGKSQMQCDGMTSKQLSRAITLLNEWKPGKCEKGLLQ